MITLRGDHVFLRKSPWIGIGMFLNFNCPKNMCNLQCKTWLLCNIQCWIYETPQLLYLKCEIRYEQFSVQYYLTSCKLLYFIGCHTVQIPYHTCPDKVGTYIVSNVPSVQNNINIWTREKRQNHTIWTAIGCTDPIPLSLQINPFKDLFLVRQKLFKGMFKAAFNRSQIHRRSSRIIYPVTFLVLFQALGWWTCNSTRLANISFNKTMLDVCE